MVSQKILLTSIGTRGDVEPFLAVGELLHKLGYEVSYSFPAQFSELVPNSINHYPLSSKIIELIESKEGRLVMGKSSLWAKLKALLYLFKKGQKVNKTLVKEQLNAIQLGKPDLIIHNSKCSYPTLWGLHNKKPTILMSPVPYFLHYVKGHAHIGFNKDYGSMVNKLTYSISNYGLAKTIFDAQDVLPQKTKYSKSLIKKTLLAKKIIFSISPALFSRPDYWPNNAQVLGFHKRKSITITSVPDGLKDFLITYPKAVFITFGSMVNTDPEGISKCFFSALNALDIPTVVNIAAGGLVRLHEYENNSNFIFIDTIPYDWIMSRVYATIHHGGSGTTHTALQHGCPTLIIPHVIDQFSWNDIVYKVGAGPKGIPIKKLPSPHIKALIYDLYHNTGYKEAAANISNQMSSVSQKESLIEFIEQEFPRESL